MKRVCMDINSLSDSVGAPGSVLGKSHPDVGWAPPKCRVRVNWSIGGQGGAQPGPGPVSHRVVGGLVARCRDKGHLERLGWWLVLEEELPESEMETGGRWWLVFIPEVKGVAGRAGFMGSLF